MSSEINSLISGTCKAFLLIFVLIPVSILAGLKIFGVIDWSWWWVFTPLWFVLLFIFSAILHIVVWVTRFMVMVIAGALIMVIYAILICGLLNESVSHIDYSEKGSANTTKATSEPNISVFTQEDNENKNSEYTMEMAQEYFRQKKENEEARRYLNNEK